MNKFLLSFLLFGAASFVSHAATHLVINKGMADEQSVGFDMLKQVNFMENGLEFSTSDSALNLSMPFSRIATIHFDSQSYASKVGADLNSLRVTVNPSRTSLTLSGYEDGWRLEIYSITGSRVLMIPAYRGEDIDISQLTSGVYVVKVGNQIQKFVK